MRKLVNQTTIIKLYKGGLTSKKIAEILNLHRTTVRYNLKKAGIKSRNTIESNKFRRVGSYTRYDSNGYKCIKLPLHPDSNYAGWVKEHRLIMEYHIGRPLKKGEEVHHEDEDRLNNNINNLKLFKDKAAHMRYHMNQRIKLWKKHIKKKCCGK